MARSIEMARVFYTLRAETQGLEKDLKGAERQLGKLGDYIKANPVAAAGALGVALLGVAAKATQMAEAVETGFRRLGALVPGLTDNIQRARDGVAALAQETGRSQEELLANAQAIAEQGVENTEDLLARLRLVTNLAKVTGTDVGAIAAGLDQVLDVFGLAADRASEVGARLFAMAKGKAPLEDLFAAIQGAAPGIRDMGLSFDVAAQALTTLLAEGRNPKQAASELKDLAKQGAAGRTELERLAGAAQSGATAFGVLDASLKSVNDTTSEQLRKLKVSWENFAIFMGQKIVPVLTTVLRLLTPESASIDAIIRRQIERGRAATSGALGGAPGRGGSPPPGGDVDARIAAAAAALRRDLQQQLAQFSATLVDDAVAAVERFRSKMAEQLGQLSAAERAALQPLVDQVLGGLQAAVQEAKLLERMAALLKLQPASRGPAIPIRGVDTLNAQFLAQQQKEQEAEEALARARQEAIQSAAAEAQAIEQAGRGAIQLAESMGILSDQAAEAAQAMLQIGNSVAQLSALSKLPGGLSLESAIPNVLSIAGGLASLIGSLFGESPEERRRREIQQENTEAIRELSRQVGQFGGRLAGTAGSTVLGVQAAGQAALGRPGPFTFLPTVLPAELAQLGLTMGDLKDVAQSLGISFANAVPSVSELRQLLDAIAANQLAQRTGSFAGQLEQLQDVFEVFDITDPLEQLRRLVALFDDPKFGAPALRQALAGLDLSTPEGRAAAEKAIQALIERLGKAPTEGGIALGDLGGLSPEQFRQALLDLERRLDELGQAGAAQGQTSQFAVQRTITEAQANLLASLLTSDAYWNEQTARNTAAIAAALGASLPAGALAPPASSAAALPAGVIIDTLQVTLSLPAGTDLSTGAAVGSAVAQGVVAGLDQVLGQRVRVRKLLTGNVVQV